MDEDDVVVDETKEDVGGDSDVEFNENVVDKAEDGIADAEGIMVV